MEIVCKTCKETVSGPVEASVKAAMKRHDAKRHSLRALLAKKKA